MPCGPPLVGVAASWRGRRCIRRACRRGPGAARSARCRCDAPRETRRASSRGTPRTAGRRGLWRSDRATSPAAGVSGLVAKVAFTGTRRCSGRIEGGRVADLAVVRRRGAGVAVLAAAARRASRCAWPRRPGSSSRGSSGIASPSCRPLPPPRPSRRAGSAWPTRDGSDSRRCGWRSCRASGRSRESPTLA